MDDPANPLGVLAPDVVVDPAATRVPADLPESAAPDGTGLMATGEAAASSAGVSRAPRAGTQLETTHGRTTIADVVVARTAAQAAGVVEGVHSFGRPAARALAALGGRIPGGRGASARGVTVEVGDQQAAIDLSLVVEYGAPIAELARVVRRRVVQAVEAVTGLQVLEVNIEVTDLHQPGRTAAVSATGGGRSRTR